MTVISLDALGVTSTGAVASLLATLLATSPAPATLVLEDLARTRIRIEVLGRADRELTAAEHYRLDAGPITAGHHRSGLLRTASGMVAAKTSLVILPGGSPRTPATPWPAPTSRPARSWPRSACSGWTGVPCTATAAWTPPAGTSRSSPLRCSPSTAPRWPSPPSGSPGTCAA